MKNRIRVVMLIIGTLIGAGFASGREIYLFFTRFGLYGQIGMIISTIITTLIIYEVLNKSKKYEITDYNQLLGKLNSNNKKINKLISWIVNSFLLISFYIMVAGFSAYISQTYKAPSIISSIFFVLICFIVFNKSLKGVMKANEVLVPVLIILITYLGIKNLPYLIETKAEVYIETIKKGWLVNSILYASYNSIILIPVLTNLKDYISDKKDISIISLAAGIIILILAFLIHGLLLKGQFYIKELELPLIQVSLEFGNIFKYLYGIVIIISIFTSAISVGYGFLQNVTKNEKQYKIILILMCITAILISSVGFSKLVEMLYPIFGIFGTIQIMVVLKKNTK